VKKKIHYSDGGVNVCIASPTMTDLFTRGFLYLIPHFRLPLCSHFFNQEMKMNDLTIIVLAFIAADVVKATLRKVFGDSK